MDHKNISTTTLKGSKTDTTHFFHIQQKEQAFQRICRDYRTTEIQKECPKQAKVMTLIFLFFRSVLTMEEFEVQKQGPFFPEYVSEALSKIKVLAEKVMDQGDDVSNNKSPGTDGFCPRVLRELECEIAKLQTVVCRKLTQCQRTGKWLKQCQFLKKSSRGTTDE